MFAPVTTHHGVEPKTKEYSWSYSKLKNWRTCGRRYMEVDILKHFQEKHEPGGPLDVGDQVHKAMAARLDNGTPLPGLMRDYEKWAKRVEAGRTALAATLLTEQKFAIRRDFTPTQWFANDVWYRAIADVLVIAGNVALLIDWKTGKITDDPVQLALAAACVFLHYPEVQQIRCEFVWLQFDAETEMTITRDQMPTLWAQLMPELDDLEHDTANKIDQPKRSGICKSWCVVKSCEFHGKRPDE